MLLIELLLLQILGSCSLFLLLQFLCSRCLLLQLVCRCCFSWIVRLLLLNFDCFLFLECTFSIGKQ